MGKRGRPPKKGERHACGKLKQPTASRIPGCASIYVIKCGLDGPVKIGKAVNPGERLEELQVSNPEELYLRWCCRGKASEIVRLERLVHSQLRQTSLHKRGEWYHISAKTAVGFVRSVASSLGIQIETDARFCTASVVDLAMGA